MTSQSLVILKFGGSVLADAESIPAAVREVLRYLASHDRVLAVVSAFRGQTDALERAALARCPHPSPDTLAFHMGLGEMRSTTELTLGLQAAGIPATLRMPWDVSLVSNGSPLHATPVAVSGDAFFDAFREHRAVVFPGFLGRGRDGQPHVLGRGGSDLTAIFLAAELGAGRCFLLKDTPGIFERDPARRDGHSRRYTKISWEDAVRLGGPVLWPAHVEYARSRSIAIEVTGIGKSYSTTVGPEESQFDPPGELEQSEQGTSS